MLAALGPKMLELARTRTAGTHPYLVTPELTAQARAGIGPDGLVASEQGVVLETDPDHAPGRPPACTSRPTSACRTTRTTGSARASPTTTSPTAAATASSTRSSCGATRPTIAARVQEHRDAGADHVCIQVLTDDPRALPTEQWRALAPVLTA